MSNAVHLCCISQLMCEPYDSQVLSTSTIIPGCLRGIFKTPQELDDYEKVWHTSLACFNSILQLLEKLYHFSSGLLIICVTVVLVVVGNEL